MSSDDDIAIAFFSEVLMIDQLARARVAKALPKGMELSHFSVLNHLAHAGAERSPAQLSAVFHLTKGAMTNTLKRLEWSGWVHIRPDWDDGRKKWVAISPAGQRAREAALSAISPVILGVMREVGSDRIREILPVLRDLRIEFSQKP